MSDTYINDRERPIGVFDSGLGGLTSVRELERLLPGEDIIYFGDTGRVPYGTRSAQTVKKYSMDDLRFLLKYGIKAVLVACGTVSSISLSELCEASPVPVVGVVKPASEASCALALELKDGNLGERLHIAVLGTPATAKNGAYVREITRICPEAQVLPIGCPMFVPLVENGYTDSDNPVTLLVAKEYIARLCEFRPSAIILGCTHYPLIRGAVERACLEVLGYLPSIVDSGACAAREIAKLLECTGIKRNRAEGGVSRFFVSDETHNFSASASSFLGREIENVTRIEIDKV